METPNIGYAAAATTSAAAAPLDMDSFEKIKAAVRLSPPDGGDSSHSMAEAIHAFMNFTRNKSCGKCIPCREGTKRMLAILKRIEDRESSKQDIELLLELTESITNTAPCGIGKRRNLVIDPKICIGCTKCARSCPVQAISGEKKQPHELEKSKCIKCMTCIDACPVGAIYALDKDGVPSRWHNLGV
jgi:NADH-quinone oxidoreductase subunit F